MSCAQTTKAHPPAAEMLFSSALVSCHELNPAGLEQPMGVVVAVEQQDLDLNPNPMHQQCGSTALRLYSACMYYVNAVLSDRPRCGC